MKLKTPFVSIVVPCRNEAAHIDECLSSIRATSYPQDAFEVIVVDGDSDDGTADIVESIARTDDRIRLVANPRRITPVALNLGIRRSRGEIVIRMDAHCIYPVEYVSALVAALEASGADNVGAACRTLPSGTSIMARAIAAAVSNPLGAGNAHFRLGVSEPRWVDTVPFGCYRRTVFDRIGLFDEDLVRNQDDEFNARLLRAGGRILLIPDVTSSYFARSSLSKLFRTYWQYGLFKPLAARRAGGFVTVRQFIPSLFVLALLAGALLAPWFAPARWALAAQFGVYAVAIAAASGAVACAYGLRVAAASCAVFPVLHVSYGAGFLVGLSRLSARARTSRAAEAIPLSR